jgi:hypothetical protein
MEECWMLDAGCWILNRPIVHFNPEQKNKNRRWTWILHELAAHGRKTGTRASGLRGLRASRLQDQPTAGETPAGGTGGDACVPGYSVDCSQSG